MKPRQGFTYVELVVVMTIICMLAAVALPNFMEARIRAGVSRSKVDLVTLQAAIEAYRIETRTYPRNRETAVPEGWDLACITTPVAYLARLPMDFFSLPGAMGAPPKGAGGIPAAPLPYRYYNALQTDPVEGLRMEAAATGGFEGSGFIAGLIWGMGPALTSRVIKPGAGDGRPVHIGHGTTKASYGPEIPMFTASPHGEAVMTRPRIFEAGEQNTLLSRDGEVALWPYDPTNGTTSRGDLYARLP